MKPDSSATCGAEDLRDPVVTGFAAASEEAGESPRYLSTMRAGSGDYEFAIAVALVSSVIFFALAPYAQLQLPRVPAFIPIYESALVINDLVTAVLLFSQFHILRTKSLLLLAGGYLFTALMTVSHALTFPGLFAPGGLLGAGPQSTAWLYMFWHGGFPLAVIGYALLKGSANDRLRSRRKAGLAVPAAFAVAAAVVIAFTLLATAGQNLLPPIMRGDNYTPAMLATVTSVWASSLLALVVLWRRRPHTVLDLWLMVVMCVWIFDIALSAVLNAGRFDLGFYAGRIYGLLAASFVLVVMLVENERLYIRLAETHELERKRSRDLQALSIEHKRHAEERRLAIEALHDKEEQIRAIVDNLNDCVLTIDAHGMVRSANPALTRVLGYAADEVVGRNVSMLVPEPHRDRHDDYLERYLRTGEARIIGIGREVEGLHKDGRHVPLELSVSEYAIHGQRIFIGMLRDIRERRQFVAELTQARAEAEQANRAKSAFLATMSHEIRAPMNGVIGMAEELARGRLTPQQSGLARAIRDSATSLLCLIDDILDLSKTEAGAQGRLILVAEDDETNRKLIQQQIGLLGHACVVAADGQEALSLWRAGRYALLITDLHMPDVDGYTLAQTIRREEASREAGRERMPILALTANALHGEAARALAAGMDEFLTKPVELARLQAAIEKWLPHPAGAVPALSQSSKACGGNSAALDVTILRALVGGDDNIVQGLLADYLASAKRLAIELRAASEGGEYRKVEAITHKLKSSSRSVGALVLGDLCHELEGLGRAADNAAISRQMPRFEVALADVEAFINSYLLEQGQ